MDHISIPVRGVARTRSFYQVALVPLGWTCSGFRDGVLVGFKKAGSPALYFNPVGTVATAHLAFKARSEEEVRAFYSAALQAGAADSGPPGPRPAYGASYYAAFVLDPDGHNVEAVLGGVGSWWCGWLPGTWGRRPPTWAGGVTNHARDGGNGGPRPTTACAEGCDAAPVSCGWHSGWSIPPKCRGQGCPRGSSLSHAVVMACKALETPAATRRTHR